VSLALRVGVLLGAGLLAAGAWTRGRPEAVTPLAWVHPIAPPLTHVPGAGEETLLPQDGRPPPAHALREGVARVVRATGTPAQRAALAQAGPTREGATARARAHALREAVTRDAAALMRTLGPARVAAMLAAREELSWRYAEGKAWTTLVEGAPAPAPVAP
jgi:hypothetical protein